MADKEKMIDSIADYGGAAAGAAVGAGIGTLVAGPFGAIGGALAGTVVERIFSKIGSDIKERMLSKSESKKIGSVITMASEKIRVKIKSGKQLRNDDFFDEKIDDRSPAEEILEATLFAAQREYEERKLPYLANLYTNINFDPSIKRGMANQLIKLAESLSYRQLVMMRVIGAYQTKTIQNAPPLRGKRDGVIQGYQNISIASELLELYRNNLIFSKSVIFSVADIIPAELNISGNGALIYNLMELPQMEFDDTAKEIITFLAQM